uniref:Kelch repeat protein n=2 Tax=Mesocestoides corti TaxID=53468 RepID=A0A5K3FRE0_MESCO
AWKLAQRPRISSVSSTSRTAGESSLTGRRFVEHLFAYSRDALPEDFVVIEIMPAQRKHATSAYDMTLHMDWTNAVFNDCIYMIGGVNANDRPTSLVDIMKPLTRSFVKAPSMKQARFKAAAATKDTQILVFGGFCHQKALSSCERFDILANRWTRLPDMPTSRFDSAAINIPNVGIVVVGGRQTGDYTLDTAELLTGSEEDDEYWAWRGLTPMLERRVAPGVAYYHDRVFVAGGAGFPSISVECFHLHPDGNDAGQWTQIRGPLMGQSLVVFNDKLLLADEDGEVHEYSSASVSKDYSKNVGMWRPLFTLREIESPILFVLRKDL